MKIPDLLKPSGFDDLEKARARRRHWAEKKKKDKKRRDRTDIQKGEFRRK